MSRRYEFRSAGSSKFWEIDEPESYVPVGYVVRVRFGKIGTIGKVHQNVFWSQRSADEHYRTKVNEKLRKGYTECGQTQTHHHEPSVGAFISPVVPVAKPCEHVSLTKTSDNVWKCAKCKTQIEFEKQPSGVEIEPARVRRFINLRRLA